VTLQQLHFLIWALFCDRFETESPFEKDCARASDREMSAMAKWHMWRALRSIPEGK